MAGTGTYITLSSNAKVITSVAECVLWQGGCARVDCERATISKTNNRVLIFTCLPLRTCPMTRTPLTHARGTLAIAGTPARAPVLPTVRSQLP